MHVLLRQICMHGYIFSICIEHIYVHIDGRNCIELFIENTLAWLFEYSHSTQIDS